jgi:hypothetical protein
VQKPNEIQVSDGSSSTGTITFQAADRFFNPISSNDGDVEFDVVLDVPGPADETWGVLDDDGDPKEWDAVSSNVR